MKKVFGSGVVTLILITTILTISMVDPVPPKIDAQWEPAVGCIATCILESGWCVEDMRETCFLDCYNWNC